MSDRYRSSKYYVRLSLAPTGARGCGRLVTSIQLYSMPFTALFVIAVDKTLYAEVHDRFT